MAHTHAEYAQKLDDLRELVEAVNVALTELISDMAVSELVLEDEKLADVGVELENCLVSTDQVWDIVVSVKYQLLDS